VKSFEELLVAGEARQRRGHLGDPEITDPAQLVD